MLYGRGSSCNLFNQWGCVCVVQEELAFVFEMLQQFEDALVQYDELDALFTQYVLNFGAGGTMALFTTPTVALQCDHFNCICT